MLKYLGILIVGILTSFYFFPFEFAILPGFNTKMFMAVIGLVIGGWKKLQSGVINVDRTFIILSIYAIIVSLICLFSITYNGTPDMAYTSYIVSMWVWLSGAYALCYIMKSFHCALSINIVTNYLVAVCVVQCLMAILIDTVPEIQRVVDQCIYMDQEFMKRTNRLYSLGACLDTAGVRFSLVLVLLMNLMLNIQNTIYKKYLWLYVISYIMIIIIGNMMARTTIVGGIISLFYLILESGICKFALNSKVRELWLWIVIIVGITLCYIINKYNTDSNFYNDIRFAFEGFFSLYEKGEWQVGSNTQLSNMIVFPDNIKTWIIGDGYFNNPINVDLNYIGEITGGYYKNTDIGYLRFIFYSGIIGLVAFGAFICKAAQLAIERFRGYKTMIFLLLLIHFLIWLKVSTDCFLIFALLLCIPKENKDECHRIVAFKA